MFRTRVDAKPLPRSTRTSATPTATAATGPPKRRDPRRAVSASRVPRLAGKPGPARGASAAGARPAAARPAGARPPPGPRSPARPRSPVHLPEQALGLDQQDDDDRDEQDGVGDGREVGRPVGLDEADDEAPDDRALEAAEATDDDHGQCEQQDVAVATGVHA